MGPPVVPDGSCVCHRISPLDLSYARKDLEQELFGGWSFQRLYGAAGIYKYSSDTATITRFHSLFPRRDNFGVDMDRFNDSMDRELRTVRDFLLLHYKATERNGSELWNYCRNIAVPDFLRKKLELYQSGSWLERDNQELFGVDSWLSVLNGQHVRVDSYSPRVDTLPKAKLESILRETREVMKCATAMPLHADFIRKHCAVADPGPN